MRTVRVLQETPARRLSSEVETKVKKFGSWFIQFSQFTHIRVSGCTAFPKRLLRYPPDRILLMELARQLEQYDKIMKLKGETGVTFSLMIDNDNFLMQEHLRFLAILCHQKYVCCFLCCSVPSFTELVSFLFFRVGWLLQFPSSVDSLCVVGHALTVFFGCRVRSVVSLWSVMLWQFSSVAKFSQ